MTQYLSFIFGEVDFNTLTPIALVCIYTFALLLECIGSIFHSTMKVGGVN